MVCQSFTCSSISAPPSGAIVFMREGDARFDKMHFAAKSALARSSPRPLLLIQMLLSNHAGNGFSVPAALHSIAISAFSSNGYSIHAGRIDPAIEVPTATASFPEVVVANIAGSGAGSSDGCIGELVAECVTAFAFDVFCFRNVVGCHFVDCS